MALRERIAGGHMALRERIAGGQMALRERIAGGRMALRERIAGGHMVLREKKSEDCDMERNQILKIYGTDYKQMTKTLLAGADLAAQIADRNSRIALKPNLVSASEPSYGATTHPEVLAGIIEYLQENGFRAITLMEGSWVGGKTMEAFRLCGYDALVEQYGVRFVDTQKERSHSVDCAGLKLNLCDCVDDIDFLINVPVLKGHCQTKITCALKNMKGLIPNSEKRRFHTMGLHKPIAHLNAGIRQDFIVVDHICGDLDFEDGGNPVVCNCVMVARDPVLVDAYVCKLQHYEVDEVPYVRLAQQLGVGNADLAQAEIITYEKAAGRGLSGGAVPDASGAADEQAVREGFGAADEEAVREGFGAADKESVKKGTPCFWRQGAMEDEELPRARKIVELRDAVEEVESCSACYGYLMPALERLKNEGLLNRLDEKICIGQGYQGRTGKIGIGRCTSGFEHNVRGCPPTEQQIYDFLKAYLSSRS